MLEAPVFQDKFHRYKKNIGIAVLVILHVVGLVGLLLDEYRESFLALSAVNLSISFIILIITRNKQTVGFYLFMVFAFFVGMTVEWIGVHSGLLFGDYYYGESLGFKWYGVPLIIGVNWVMLTIISAAVAKRLRLNTYLQALVAAFLMLVLDILIEPVAIVSDYWYWSGDIPLSNFVTWFIVALFLQLIWFHFKLAEKNKVAFSLYCIQVTFFIILNSF